ncbi:MAG TPA: hypothetical protein VJQ47_13400 [Steroidobacteraceae bacterium]|nr:hypothetical protein [Steroidobacteraceae bacterium]
MSKFINSVAGPIGIEDLGKTLMHEHLAIGLPGWEADALAGVRTKADLIARCVDLIQELQSHGFRSLLDPCPNDIGRDTDLMGEVAGRTGFNILFATGLYEDVLAGSYWKLKAARDPDAEKYITDMYIREIEHGVPGRGCKPAIIKVATGRAPFTSFEQMAMRAAAAASIATGLPITTHTAGADGDRQLQYLTDCGVSPHRVIVGHSCGSSELHYHRSICQRGAYIGFDRFGLTQFNSDENRVASLCTLLNLNYAPHIIVSHDCVFNMRGQLMGRSDAPPVVTPMHFVRHIAPLLRDRGVEQTVIDALLIDNPRRYFQGIRP